MSTITKSVLAQVLLAFIVLSVAGGVYLLSLDVTVAAIAGLVTFVGVKLDDLRIRRARRRAVTA